jgi:hypothetical protein
MAVIDSELRQLLLGRCAEGRAERGDGVHGGLSTPEADEEVPRLRSAGRFVGGWCGGVGRFPAVRARLAVKPRHVVVLGGHGSTSSLLGRIE